MSDSAHDTEQNGTEKPLTGKQRQAAVLCAEDTLSDEAISEKLGIGRTTLSRWRVIPTFQDAIADHATELEKQMLRLAVTRRNQRIEVLDDLHSKALAVVGARADQYAEVPGGSTGLLVGQLKQVRHVEQTDEKTNTWSEDHWEYAVDVSLMKEIRSIHEQAAKELGQWVDRSELATNLTSRIQIIGVDEGDI